MNVEKLIQVTGYILDKYDGVLNYTKLIKLLYLSDRKSFKETGYSISGDTYVSMKNGPVLSSLYDLIKNKSKDKALQYYWNSKFATDGYKIHKVCPFIPIGELNKNDTEIIDGVDSQFHDKTFSQMIDYVHDKNNCPEWENTYSSKPISKITIMRNVGLSDSDINILLEEEASYNEEENIIKQLDYPIKEEAYV